MEQKDTQQKIGETNGQAERDTALNTFYFKHNRMSVMLKKTEKISTAVYMVTDFSNDSEPLKWVLRTAALDLLGTVRKVASLAHDPHSVLGDEVVRTVEQINSLLLIASTIGIVSEMNATILTSELQKIQTEIVRLYGDKKVSVVSHTGYANIVLTPELFTVDSPDPILPVSFNKGQEIYKGQKQEPIQSQNKTAADNKKQESFSGKNVIGIKIARRNDVLNVIKSKGKVSIKDISLILKDISEKTIQRELLALVSSGVLKKEGEKRWSTYRIAS